MLLDFYIHFPHFLRLLKSFERQINHERNRYENFCTCQLRTFLHEIGYLRKTIFSLYLYQYIS